MNYTACIPKNCGHHLSGRLYGLRLLRSCFTRWSPLLFLRLGCEIMDPCFVHSNESTQKFIWITLKHLQILFWNRHTVALMIHRANAAPILLIAFSYPIVCAKLKSLWYACGLNKLFRSSISQNNIVDFIDFWRSSLNWTSQTRCITCGCMFKFIHPIVYNRKRWCRCAMNIIQLGFDFFWLIFHM